MESQQMDTSGPGGGRSRFQFSLRTMLVVTTITAIVLSGIFAGPGWLSLLTALLLTLTPPTGLTVGLIYGKGYGRTFCIGALFPAGLILIVFGPGMLAPFYGLELDYDLDGEERLFIGLFAFIALWVIIGFGLLAMWIRRLIETPRAGQ